MQNVNKEELNIKKSVYSRALYNQTFESWVHRASFPLDTKIYPMKPKKPKTKCQELNLRPQKFLGLIII